MTITVQSLKERERERERERESLSHTYVQLLKFLLRQIKERSDFVDHRGVQHLVLGLPYHVLREYPKSVQVLLSRIILLLVPFHENLKVFLSTHHVIVQEFLVSTSHLSKFFTFIFHSSDKEQRDWDWERLRHRWNTLRLREQGGLRLRGVTVGHSGEVRKTDQAARRDVASVWMGDQVWGLTWWSPSLSVPLVIASMKCFYVCICEVFEARYDFTILG